MFELRLLYICCDYSIASSLTWLFACARYSYRLVSLEHISLGGSAGNKTWWRCFHYWTGRSITFFSECWVVEKKNGGRCTTAAHGEKKELAAKRNFFRLSEYRRRDRLIKAAICLCLCTAISYNSNISSSAKYCTNLWSFLFADVCAWRRTAAQTWGCDAMCRLRASQIQQVHTLKRGERRETQVCCC